MRACAQSGQAAVESALTLPLVVFLMLGTLQLFLLLQARMLAHFALQRAARHGSVNFGSCRAMEQVALMFLLPAINSGFAAGPNRGRSYYDAVRFRLNNRFRPEDGQGNDQIVWLARLSPAVPSARDSEDFWSLPTNSAGRTLSVQMVFWAPLKVPFAGQVFARIALSWWGLRSMSGAAPWQLTRVEADDGPRAGPSPWSGVFAGVGSALSARIAAGHHVFPLEASATVQMMSPPRWEPRACWGGP